MAGHGSSERVDHDGAGDPGVGGDGQGVAGVVIQPRQDLDVDAGGQPVVGEVGLPPLVGLLGGEADVGGSGPLGWCRGDESVAAQGAVDRRSRDPDLVVVFEVPTDRVGAGIETLGGQSPAQLDDELDRRVGDRRR